MKKYVVLLLSLLAFAAFSTPVFADYEQKDIDEMQADLAAGKEFQETGYYHRTDQQVAVIKTRFGSYRIDFKTKLCTLSYEKGLVLIPCKTIKEGYPMFAPLMPWAK